MRIKRFLSIVLAAIMLISTIPTVLATNDYTQGTQVVYQSSGSESYTITVPALLTPGGSGTVTLSGTWADNRIVTVTSDQTVILTNSIKADDQKVLMVSFPGMSKKGSNVGPQTFVENVSVESIDNALFGVWSGKFNYNVELKDFNGILPKESLNDYTWSELSKIAADDSIDLNEYGISIGDTKITDDGTEYILVSDERTKEYNGLVFLYNTNQTLKMNSSKTNTGGYVESNIKQTIDAMYYDLDADLQAALREVTIKCNDGLSNYATIHEADVYLFIPSVREASATFTVEEYSGREDDAKYTTWLDAEGATFDYFKTNEASAREAIAHDSWWLRSAYGAAGGMFHVVYNRMNYDIMHTAAYDLWPKLVLAFVVGENPVCDGTINCPANQNRHNAGCLSQGDYTLDLDDYTWTEIQQIARDKNANLNDYGIDIGDTIEHNGIVYHLVSDERNEAYGGLVFMFDPNIERPMNDTQTNTGGYSSSTMKDYLDVELFATLPTDLQQVIKQVTISHNDGKDNYLSMHEVDVKVFLPSVREVAQTYGYSESLNRYDVYLNAEGSTFDYFIGDVATEETNRIAVYPSTYAWLRSANTSVSTSYWFVSGSILNTSHATATGYYVVPAFVVG